ncbi:MAG: signal-transducing histidine kinase [Nevskia sp.]|nr:signal-transducing histidine kinase [Nevskia sp.]
MASVARKRAGKRTAAVTVGAAVAGAAPDYRALVEAAGDIIYTLDLDGRFTLLNPAVQHTLGYTLSETVGRRFTDFLTADGALTATKHFSQGLAGTENTPFFEVEARHKSGGTVHLEIRAGALYRDGVLIGRQGICRDISELKKLQSEIAHKSERLALLEERNRIAMNLYERIAGLAREDAGDPLANHQTLRQIHEVVLQASAEKLGLRATDVKIIELVAQGHSNREIADLVHRSPHTIKDHIKKIMQRLGAKRRSGLVATALSLGLIAAQSSSN